MDWTCQVTDGTFSNSVFRSGIRWRLDDGDAYVGQFFREVLKLRLAISFHAIETDAHGWQMEYAYRRDFFDKKMYLAGFADQNINGASPSTWVTEHQIGWRLVDRWYAVAEYRYNNFLPLQYRSGWGLGIEYFVPLR